MIHHQVPRSPRGRRPAGIRRPALIVLAAVLTGCGARASDPPEAGYARGDIPELRGQTVLLLPAQNVRGGHPDLENEMVFALEDRGGAVDWVTPALLRERVRRSPELGIALDRLAVQPFLSGRLERIGDPLYGELYRLGAIEGADIALLPVEVRERPAVEDPDLTRVEVAASLIQLRTGRVLWFGVVEGIDGRSGELAPTASVVDVLARTILPFQ